MMSVACLALLKRRRTDGHTKEICIPSPPLGNEPLFFFSFCKSGVISHTKQRKGKGGKRQWRWMKGDTHHTTNTKWIEPPPYPPSSSYFFHCKASNSDTPPPSPKWEMARQPAAMIARQWRGKQWGEGRDITGTGEEWTNNINTLVGSSLFFCFCLGALPDLPLGPWPWLTSCCTPFVCLTFIRGNVR